jgi:hypothetical protein
MGLIAGLRKTFLPRDASPSLLASSPEIAATQGDESMLQESVVLPVTQKSPGLFTSADAQKTRRAQAWLADRLQKARSGSFVELVELTPVLAELLLANNPDNRALKPTKLSVFETDVAEGRWVPNGDTIKVSIEGLLNDGQHRCHAVIGAGRSIQTYIVFGVSRKSRLTVDQGTARTVGDYLSMEGVPSGNHCASVAALIHLVGETGYVKKSSVTTPTKGQIREVYHNNPGISDSIRVVPRKGSALVGGLSNLAFCHFMFALKDKEAADAFITQFVRGTDLKSSDPIYVARQRLMTDRRLRPEEKIEVIFRAWNAVRTRRPLRSVPIHGRLPGLER